MSQRYEREIDEILRQFEGHSNAPPRRIGPRSRFAGFRQRALQASWSAYSLRWRWGADQIMLAAYVLALASFLLFALFPFLARPIGWVIVGLLALGYASGYRKSPSRPERHWRGRPMTASQPRWSAIWENLRRQWRRR